MGFWENLGDYVLNSISATSPTLGEMRYNQLVRNYERDVEREKERERQSSSYDSWDYGIDYKALEAEARHKEREDEDFTYDIEENYSQMLKKARKLATSNNVVSELPSNISGRDIENVLREVEENLLALLECDFEFDEEFYEYESLECDARDYDEGGYDTKTEAKADCKQAIKSAIEDVNSQYDDEKMSLVSCAKSELDCLKFYISSEHEKFYKIFKETVEQSDCKEVVKKYFRRRVDEVYKQWCKQNKDIDAKLDALYSAELDKVAKSYFKTEEADLTKQTALLAMCDYTQNWRDEYKFSTKSACKTLVNERSAIMKYAMKELPIIMFKRYIKLRFEHAANLFSILYMMK